MRLQVLTSNTNFFCVALPLTFPLSLSLTPLLYRFLPLSPSPPVPPGSLEVEIESLVAQSADPVLGALVNSSTAALALTCSVRETIRGLTSSPSAQWLRPLNGSYDDKDTMTQYLNDSTVIITASFSPPSTHPCWHEPVCGDSADISGRVHSIRNITISYFSKLKLFMDFFFCASL